MPDAHSKVGEIRRGYIKRGTFGKWFETRTKAGLEAARNGSQPALFGRHGGQRGAETLISFGKSNASRSGARAPARFRGLHSVRGAGAPIATRGSNRVAPFPLEDTLMTAIGESVLAAMPKRCGRTEIRQQSQAD